MVTESWFHKSSNLDLRQESVCQDFGLKFIDRNRPRTSASNPGGGVSIVFNPAKISLKEYPFKRGSHEILAATGKIPNNTRPFFILGVYISTKLKAEKYHELLGLLSDLILKIKTEHTAPYIILGGDFNRTDIQETIGDYADMEVVATSATRGRLCWTCARAI